MGTTIDGLLRQLFQVVDTNRNGVVDLDELKAGLGPYAGSARSFEWLDANADGSITIDEFVQRQIEQYPTDLYEPEEIVEELESLLAMANEAVGRPKWTPPTLPVRTTSFAEDDEKQQADAALFRKFLVEHGSAEEIIKVLVSHYEGASGSPTLLPAELTAALGTQVAPSGKFPMALPELVKGRAAAATASSLHAENSELKSKVAQLSDTLVPKLDAAHESGLCEQLTVTLTEIHVANVPDMDPGASKSDPFLRVSVAGPQPQLEWMAQTGPSANAERVVRWEGEELSLTVPVPAWNPANCIDKASLARPRRWRCESRCGTTT